MAKLYCLKGKDGELYYDTIADTKDEVWRKSYSIVAAVEGNDWGDKYWTKALNASLASAKKMDWDIVRVNLVEEKE